MKKATIIFHVLILSALAYRAKAQDTTKIKSNSTDSISNLSESEIKNEIDKLLGIKRTYFQAELGFLSNNVYFGRKDSVATPYITPSVGYYHKSGFYLNALASYLPSPGNNRFDLFTIEAGYTRHINNLSIQAIAGKYFYNSASFNVESEIEANIVALFSYDFKFITPVIQGTLIFGPQTDYAGSFGLERPFYLFDNKLTITPAAMVNASTQNYYNSYYKSRRYSSKRFPKIILFSYSAYIIDPSQFKVLDYEFSIPIVYTFKKFTFNFLPVYAVAVSPSQVSLTTKFITRPPKTRIFTESLDNSFFFQAGVSYKF